MLVMIDNYDSFTYNLVQYLGELGEHVVTLRNDQVDLEGIVDLGPDRVMLSPGPCTPNEAGITLEVLRQLSGDIPLMGVCLGHQAIGQAFGGKVVHADTIMHGKTSMIEHDGEGLFAGLDSPFRVTRYHSLVVEKESLPDCLEVSAWTDTGEIMGLRHRDVPVEGVQFHPESILTEHGHALLQNFLNLERAIPAVI